MIEHRLHAPHLIPAPPAAAGKSCPFCHSTGTIKAGSCTSCGTAMPSTKSEFDKNKLLALGGRYKDRPKKAAPPWYTPQCSGVDEIDEAAEIETGTETEELAGLDLPEDSEDFDPDDQSDLLPPDEDLPWS